MKAVGNLTNIFFFELKVQSLDIFHFIEVKLKHGKTVHSRMISGNNEITREQLRWNGYFSGNSYQQQQLQTTVATAVTAVEL